MRPENRTVILQLMALLGAAAVLFVLVFDRYSYRDYDLANCETGSVALIVSLLGGFSPERPQERGSPYFLRVEILGEGKEAFSLSEIRLTSSASKKNVDLGNFARVDVDRPGEATPAVVYLADSLRLDYEDYVLGGVLVAGSNESDGRIAFTCPVYRNPRSE